MIDWVKEEQKMTKREFQLKSVGKKEPLRHLKEEIEELRNRNIISNFSLSSSSMIF